jgi:hypothetical protein
MNEEPNPHISEELKQKWVNYSFLGKPFKLGDGKTYMRAQSHAFEALHYYCFEDDFFWHERPRIDTKKVEETYSDLLT